MTTTLLKRCAAGGSELSKRDQRNGKLAMVAFSLLFGGLYVLAAYLYRGNELVDALGIMHFPRRSLWRCPSHTSKDSPEPRRP